MTIHEPPVSGEKTPPADVENAAGFHKSFGFTSIEVQDPVSGAPPNPPSTPVRSTVAVEPEGPKIQVSAIGIWELILGSVALAAWFVLFAGGILINTEPYRDRIAGANSANGLMTSWLVVLSFWTITNVGLLSCLGAILGALGRRTRFTMQAASDPEIASLPEDAMGALVFYYSAIMRGFGIYALVFAGLFVLATEAFMKPQPGDYLRLAATMSIASFYAGYDPTVFAMVLSRAKRLFDAGDVKK